MKKVLIDMQGYSQIFRNIASSSSGETDSMRIRFTDEVCPLIIWTDVFESCNRSAMRDIIALFAFPSVACAWTCIPTAFRQGLNPSGNLDRLLPADTSITKKDP